MKKILSIFLLLVMATLLASCAKKTDAPKTNNKTTTKANVTTALVTTTKNNETTKNITTTLDAQASEDAMNNFFDKLYEYNYSIEAQDFLKINIYSNDLVYFDYEKYYDEAYFTINTDETFRGVIRDKGSYSIDFYGEGDATDILYKYLPNYWIEYSDYNIWNIITNSVDNPLEYTFSSDSFIKETIGSTYLGLGPTAIAGIKEMVLTLDNVNPTQAVLSLKYIDNGQLSPVEESKTITINLGIGEKEELPIDEWVDNPNRVYPSAKIKWNSEDEANFNVAFNQGYNINDLMPFPEFATYAFILDNESLYYNGILEFRDKKASEDDMNEYITQLVNVHHFTKETETDMYGNTKEAYHKQIDDFGNGYYAYSSIYIEYDEGINITVRKYYNHKLYNGLDSLNTLITDKNFASFDASDDILSVDTTDFTYEYIEGWANLFTYDLVIDVMMEFKDSSDIDSYMSSYITKLTNDKYVHDETNKILTFSSESYKNTLIYQINPQTNVLMMQIKSEKFITDDEISAKLTESRFPSMDLTEIDSICKNITPLYRILYGQVHKNVYLISLTFKTLDERNAFLNDYIDGKCMKQGFDIVSPVYARVPHKTNAYYNETEKLILCFNYPEDSLSVSLQLIEAKSDFEPLSE